MSVLIFVASFACRLRHVSLPNCKWNIFYLHGRTLPANIKRRRINPQNFAGKPGKYLRGKEPNIASHGDLAIQKQFSRSRFIRFRSKSKKSQQQKFRLKIFFESLKSLNVLKMLFRCILKFLKIQWYDRNNLATLNQKQFWGLRSIRFHKIKVKI